MRAVLSILMLIIHFCVYVYTYECPLETIFPLIKKIDSVWGFCECVLLCRLKVQAY